MTIIKAFPSLKSYSLTFVVAVMIEKYIRFLTSFRSLVDMAVIIPYYFLMKNDYFSGVTFVCVFRAFEIFNLLPKKRDAVEHLFMMLNLTLYKSLITLCIFAVVAVSLIIFFGSVMYELESGTFVVNAQFPNGYMQIYQYGTGS